MTSLKVQVQITGLTIKIKSFYIFMQQEGGNRGDGAI